MYILEVIMKKFSQKFKKILESKITTAVAVIILLTPFLIFGFIIYRDSSQTGAPVVGNRFENGLNPEITDDQITEVESKLDDETIISKKVVLKSATLRIYLEVDEAINKEQIKELAEKAYASTIEVLPIEPYFTLEGNRKQYDLEIHVYNNVEDRDTEEFVYYQIMKSSNLEDFVGEFLTDTRDPDFRDEVLENLAEKEKAAEEAKKAEAEKTEENDEKDETEEDKGGE